MNISQQVSTLEQSKKLYDLGITGPTVFYHVFDSGMKWCIMPDGFFNKEEEGIEFYPAFTVAELGMMLPENIHANGHTYFFSSQSVDKRFEALYSAIDVIIPCLYLTGSYSTEAEARSAMLLFVVEDKITTPAECNIQLAA